MAQERAGARKPPEQTRQIPQGAKAPPLTQAQRLQHMAQQTEQRGQEIRETNRWMEQNQVREEYRACAPRAHGAALRAAQGPWRDAGSQDLPAQEQTGSGVTISSPAEQG